MGTLGYSGRRILQHPGKENSFLTMVSKHIEGLSRKWCTQGPLHGGFEYISLVTALLNAVMYSFSPVPFHTACPSLPLWKGRLTFFSKQVSEEWGERPPRELF